MDRNNFVSGELWEPLVDIPIALNPHTGKWMSFEDLFPETIIDPDELSEWNE